MTGSFPVNVALMNGYQSPGILIIDIGVGPEKKILVNPQIQHSQGSSGAGSEQLPTLEPFAF